MDPNTTLKEMLELATLIADSPQPWQHSADADRLAELVLALDGWLMKGGFLPHRWVRS